MMKKVSSCLAGRERCATETGTCLWSIPPPVPPVMSCLDADPIVGARKRSTRGRNPLPPSSGPLFPPLPPKLPKSRISGNSFGADLEPPLETSPAQSEKPDLPSTSNASLTPPPPGSEDVLLDDEEEEEEANDAEGTESGNKEVVKPKIEVEEATEADVKQEELARNMERSESHSRAKRRRGEEALLLDDHLLPPEIRHISQQSTSRRSSNAKGDLEDERRRKKTPRDDIILDDRAVGGGAVERPRDPSWGKTMDTVGSARRREEEMRQAAMEEEENEGEIEVEGEGEDEEEDEDGGQDITRCVCQTDGESYSTQNWCADYRSGQHFHDDFMR